MGFIIPRAHRARGMINPIATYTSVNNLYICIVQELLHTPSGQITYNSITMVMLAPQAYDKLSNLCEHFPDNLFLLSWNGTLKEK